MTRRQRLKRVLAPIPGAVALVRLVMETIRITMRYRVTGLATELGFYALMSLPPLVLGLFGGLGYIGSWLGKDTVTRITDTISRWSSTFLTNDSVREVVVPTVDDVLSNGRADLISVGFVISIWSGSRALSVFLDTVSIMYGQGGERGILQARGLSLLMYVVSVVAGALVLPLVVIGPSYLGDWLPGSLEWLLALYWPVVTLAGVGGLTTLYYVATPRRTRWRRDMPGAVFTTVFWFAIAYFARIWAESLLQGPSVYGPLSAPIIVMVWLYFMGFAVLVGAALNAAIHRLWPSPEVDGVAQRTRDWFSEVQDRRQRRRSRVTTPFGPEVDAELDEADARLGAPRHTTVHDDTPAHGERAAGREERAPRGGGRGGLSSP